MKARGSLRSSIQELPITGLINVVHVLLFGLSIDM
jgi:hypothetical protein